MRLWLLCLALLCFCEVVPASSQVFQYGENRLPLASMAGKWRFHPGDDPRFASPQIDDSQWALLSSDDAWTSQGFAHLTGMAWYRFRLAVPEDGGAYSLLLPPLYSGYECYVDGKLMVREGPMSTDAGLVEMTAIPVAIPRLVGGAAGGSGAGPRPYREVQVALRVWHSPIWASFVGGGPYPGSAPQQLFGPTQEITRYKQRNTEHLQFRASEMLAVGVLDVVAGMASLALFGLRRREWEYLWFGVAVLLPGLKQLLIFYTQGHVTSVALIDGGALVATMSSHLAFLLFYRQLLQGKANVLFRIAVVCVLMNPLPLFLLEGVGVLSVGSANLWNVALQWPYELWILLLLVRRSLQRNLDARLLLAPVTMIIGLSELEAASTILGQFGRHAWVNPDDWVLHVPFELSATNIAEVLFLVSILLILLYKFARTRREEEQYAAEFQSARQVQMLLVPETLDPVPGFTVDAEYRPARVVGGDFYQVLATAEGGLLIVVGDVAGKGLPAAMLVAMLVGAIRTQAAVSSHPMQMLATLNDRLLGRVEGSFATCLVARVSSTGTMEVANAGHPSPYLNGEEMELPGSIPLGLIAGLEASMEAVRLHVGDRLLFISDGIPEAQNGARELFGFEKVLALSRKSAQMVVEAAERFGQEDDLTAVTVDVL